MINGPDDEDIHDGEDEIEEDDEGSADEGSSDAGDDEGDDEEGDDEEGEAEGLKADGKSERQPSRYESRVQKLRRETRDADKRATEATARIEALQREMAELRRGGGARSAEDAQREEAERLALMTVEERVDYRFQKAEERHQRELAMVKFQTADNADKAAYQARAASDPRARKYAQEVETQLTASRQNGVNATREQMLAYVIGRKVLEGGKTADVQRTKAKQNVRRQETRPGNSRGDQASGRRGGKTLEERLEDVTF